MDGVTVGTLAPRCDSGRKMQKKKFPNVWQHWRNTQDQFDVFQCEVKEEKTWRPGSVGQTGPGNRNHQDIFSPQEALGIVPALAAIQLIPVHVIVNDPLKAELIATETLSAEMFH